MMIKSCTWGEGNLFTFDFECFLLHQAAASLAIAAVRALT